MGPIIFFCMLLSVCFLTSECKATDKLRHEARSFPDGFLFGAATASYQVEGAWDEDDAELWKTKFAEAQEIVRTKCSLYTQDMSSDDDESSITRSEDTDTPEPKSADKTDEDSKKASDEKDSDGVVLKLKELKVDSEQTEN